jgi:hypothetical protein
VATTTRQWEIGVGTGVLRLGIGASLIAMRGFAARVLGAERDDKVVPAILIGFGVRDSLLGLAALASTRPGGDVAGQVKLQAAFDVFDAAVTGGMTATGLIGTWQGAAVTGFSLAVSAVDFGLHRAAAQPAGLSLTG